MGRGAERIAGKAVSRGVMRSRAGQKLATRMLPTSCQITKAEAATAIMSRLFTPVERPRGTSLRSPRPAAPEREQGGATELRDHGAAVRRLQGEGALAGARRLGAVDGQVAAAPPDVRNEVDLARDIGNVESV